MTAEKMRPCEPPGPVSKPRKRAPQGATDCHFHMFGPQERYKLSPLRSYTPPPEANMTTYLAMANTLGLERFVIVHPTPYSIEDHGCTADAIEQFGRNRAKGVAVISDAFSEATLRDLDRKGFCAARLNSITSNGIPLSQLQWVVKHIAPLGWHLELYIQPEELLNLAGTLMSLPIPVVIDHMGRVPTNRGLHNAEFQTLLRLLGSGNCWVKLCGYRSSVQGPHYTELLEQAQALIQAGPERCIWGTDWPHVGMAKEVLPDAGKLLNLLYDWAPDERQLHRILVENPTEVYGFVS